MDVIADQLFPVNTRFIKSLIKQNATGVREQAPLS